MQFAVDGTTFTNTLYEYDLDGVQQNTQDSILISEEVGHNAAYGASLTIEILNRYASTFYPCALIRGARVDSSGVLRSVTGAGCRANAEQLNGVRLYCSTGNIAQARYALYGSKAP